MTRTALCKHPDEDAKTNSELLALLTLSYIKRNTQRMNFSACEHHFWLSWDLRAASLAKVSGGHA